ncbi:MAG: NUDIX hydrolase [Candidatus Krumholzibacteria bacterium]|nr:NUDIX hydrolase [Candidatus Krumholzibacteria bacterium]
MSNQSCFKFLMVVTWIGMAVCSCAASDTAAVKLPKGYWPEKKSQRILDKTVTIRLEPDLSNLKDDELAVVRSLCEVGEIMQALYEDSRHRRARTAYNELVALDNELGSPKATQNLLQLYRLFQGPLARSLDGEIVPFLPVAPKVPGKNVYPWGVDKDEIGTFLADYPDAKPSTLHVRTVVRRTSKENLVSDRTVLQDGGSLLATLHPRFAEQLDTTLYDVEQASTVPAFYAVPYSIAYAEQMIKAHGLLIRAAEIIEATDIDFSRYLRHRAFDLLRNDYEAGDASWITGDFVNLNAQIGSYESYDDELFGAKSFFGLSVLVKDRAMDSSLNTVIAWLQEFEDLMPYEARKVVRADIPIGVYNIIADFGQSRGTNTATILPNESHITRKYGRTILLRRNIMESPEVFAARKNSYEAAVAAQFHDAYSPQGDFFRTMFHEIGHYLGPDLDVKGRTFEIALEEDSSILEELKSDLVALYLAKRLFKKGYYDTSRLRGVQTAGIRRVLQKNRPRKSQVYATMQLMQMNYFLERGLLDYDRQTGQLIIHFDKYHPAVEAMLRDVLNLLYKGDKELADRFIADYTTWKKSPHRRLAESMKKAEKYRYAIVKYGFLGE